MEAAYDHIQEEVLRPEANEKQAGRPSQPPEDNLNTDFQEAYKAFSSSPWGIRLGGFLGNVRKQGENYYQGARQEASIAGEEALKGFTDLKSTIVSRARSLSQGADSGNAAPGEASSSSTTEESKAESSGETVDGATKDRAFSDSTSLESEGFISRFRVEAGKRLKEIQRAEDAADEALLKFGTNIRSFLRDAVTVAPPSEERDKDGKSTAGKVLFESKDADGRRVIHTTRFDAQLHVIHCSLDSFVKDPVSPEYARWREEGFDAGEKTEDIAKDLDKYEELRRAMEKLVPEKVEYEQFWRRYYFLRMVIESEEKRRREMLKGAALAPSEEISWDEDTDSSPSTPQATSPPLSSNDLPSIATPLASSSTANISPTTTTTPNTAALDVTSTDAAKTAEPRKSQDQNSQSGSSDASYDLVSGATSRAPGSPREEKEKGRVGREGTVQEESDEDWE